MKKCYFLIIVALIFGLVLTGCLLSNVGQVPATGQSGINYLTRAIIDDPSKIILWAGAGQNINVGTVEVWDDTVELTVKYNVPDPWCITETHLHVSNDLEDIPVNKKGNPIPGHFEKNDEHNCVHEVTYSYNLEDEEWGLCKDLYVAAHAVVVRPVDKCVEEVWMIGEEEVDDGAGKLTNYCDELNLPNNWPVDPAVYPDFPDPFVVGINNNNEFPWISNKVNDYATDFKVQWSGELLFGGELIVSWSPGKSGTETKIIKIIDDSSVNDFIVLWSTDPNGWEGYPLVTSNVELDKVCYADKHEIIFQHTTGDGALWDWIKLQKPCEQWETAWADGTRFVGKGNWATYFTYKTNNLICPGITSYSTDKIQVLDETEIPDDVRVGKFESNDYVRIWKEFEGPLPENLQYDLADGDVAKSGVPVGHPYSIDAETNVCIFYVHFDSIGDTGMEKVGTLTFGANILGVILSGGSLGDFAGKNLMFAADDLLAAYTGTTYPDDSISYPPNTDYLRGFEVNYPGNTDDVEIDGKTVDFTTWVSNAHDSFRVIVPKIPIPCE